LKGSKPGQSLCSLAKNPSLLFNIFSHLLVGLTCVLPVRNIGMHQAGDVCFTNPVFSYVHVRCPCN
jgi:hypothetical protein